MPLGKKKDVPSNANLMEKLGLDRPSTFYLLVLIKGFTANLFLGNRFDCHSSYSVDTVDFQMLLKLFRIFVSHKDVLQ